MFRKKKKGQDIGGINGKENLKDTATLVSGDNNSGIEERGDERRRTIRELVAPNGVNPNPLDYMVINDGGQNVYVMALYIEKLPTSATFASTFAPLFNFDGATSTVHINPLTSGEAGKLLDKRVLILDSEDAAAVKSGDRNRARKVGNKMSDAESWAAEIEKGANRLYEVVFLFAIMDTDLERLRIRVNDFHSIAGESGISICACYSCHPEAFLSTAPTNKIFRPCIGAVRGSVAKKHIMDKYSLACIFNHTHSDFSHKNGIIAGRNMHTGQPFRFDIYDPANNGYGLVCSGITGTGKSATIKMYLSRYADFGYQIASVDYESRGNCGEYAIMASHLGGANFQIKSNSKNTINLYELNEENEYDATTGSEIPVLRLLDKLTDLKHIMMTMMVDSENEEKPLFDDAKAMKKIIGDINSFLYEKRGIFDQDVDSLYEMGSVVKGGKITSGRVKKDLPTISEFFYEALVRRKKNKNPYHEKAYNLIIDAMADYVKELYYGESSLELFTREEYFAFKQEDEEINKKDSGSGIAYHMMAGGRREEVIRIKGERSYYDGQSTIYVDSNTPHINIDISQLPDVDKPNAQMIALNFLNENYIKRNSMDPKRARKLVMLVDEIHKMFPYPDARKFISDVYRTARKRHVSPWSATQGLSDYSGYKETEAIVKNSTAVLLLKQAFQDKQFLNENTVLTPSQVEEVLSLGGDPNDRGEYADERKGEICMICNDRVTFVKVDYLKGSEAYIVETDMSKLEQMYQRKGA
jgi:hypothetical protein